MCLELREGPGFEGVEVPAGNRAGRTVGVEGAEPQKGASMLELLKSHLRREDGQALVEYALILFLIAVVSILVLTQLGQRVSATLQSIVTAI